MEYYSDKLIQYYLALTSGFVLKVQKVLCFQLPLHFLTDKLMLNKLLSKLNNFWIWKRNNKLSSKTFFSKYFN